MQAVAIIGAGELGATTARALAHRLGTGTIHLIDDAAAVASGKALDIRQAGAIEGNHAAVAGSGRLDDAAGARVVVLADRAGAEGEWHGDAALERLRRVLDVAPRAVVVFAGARQASLLGLAHRELRVPRERLVGTAPEALASAVRALAALHAGVSSGEVSIPLLGSPSRWVFGWNDAHAAGTRLDSILGAAEMARLEARGQASWPPGPYTLGSAAARVVGASLRLSPRRFSVFAVLDGEYGARGAVMAVPATLGPHGVQQVHTPALSAREQVALQVALHSG
jgi:malate/lactate dehydrogenase